MPLLCNERITLTCSDCHSYRLEHHHTFPIQFISIPSSLPLSCKIYIVNNIYHRHFRFGWDEIPQYRQLHQPSPLMNIATVRADSSMKIPVDLHSADGDLWFFSTSNSDTVELWFFLIMLVDFVPE
jgi:hypothetical protein